MTLKILKNKFEFFKFQVDTTTTNNDPNNINSNLALPVLKINDINIQSSTSSPTHGSSKKESKARNLVDSTSLNLEAQINESNADEESEEYDEEESGDEDDEDEIDALQHNILKALRNQGHDEYDIYR